MNNSYSKAKQLVETYNQQHLLNFYDELNVDEQNRLVRQIISTDFEMVKKLHEKQSNKNGAKDQLEESIELKPLVAPEFDTYDESEKSKYFESGMNAIKKGQVAALLVAGGQGTRLGHDGPKGTYDIGLPSNKSLFQLQCERLINISKKAGNYIPWYIMTSIDNHDDTVLFFEENDYFGYPKDQIEFFSQGVLPCIDFDGKVFLSGKSSMNLAADGNGGCIVALKNTGMLENMKNRGVQWICLYGVDNVLVKVADPYFVGFTIESGIPAGTKVVAKKHAEEKVGVLCYKNNRPAIVEYTEFSEEKAQETDNDGTLVYDNSNILNHIFKLDFIEECLRLEMPLHPAYKKVEYTNDHGESVKVDQPNGIKFEYFIFDIFDGLTDMATMKVKREEEFAPVKNKDGADSPESARNMIFDNHKEWLIQGGMDPELLDNKSVEISPLKSYYGENIDIDEVKEKIEKSAVVNFE